MSSPSNLYAEKIFAEHPVALWSLDDKADYISLISESNRNFSNWTISGGISQIETNVIDEPFPDSLTNLVIGDTPVSENSQIVLTSNNIINFSELDKNLGTFSISSYIYSKSSYISGLELGYEYYDTTSGEIVQKLKTFETSISNRWIFLSETFNIPQENTTLRIVLKINYLGGSENQNDYHFLVNGITLGQWSEEFNATSLGAEKISLPSTINLTTSSVIKANSYGLQDLPGYYFVSNNSLVAKNSGIPLVYGASNVTLILPNDDKPSLIVPGMGFLNEVGRNKDYTVEFWIRVDSNSTSPKRIFGPISSTDGLYVDGPFLRLKINDIVASHYVGEWFRPMLIQIRITEFSLSMVINGEQVISESIDTKILNLPKEKNESNKEQDWLGFYSYEDISPMEIDCVAIYPYYVSNILAKKRWVYGQAVDFPENINTAYSGKSVFIDYQFANYANNYSYPDIGSWNQGIVENLSVINNVLSTPDYNLPEVIFNNKDFDSWIQDCSIIQQEENLFINLKPNSTWNNTNGYILFNNIDMLKQDTKAIFGTFKTLSQSASKQELLRFENEISGNFLSIYLEQDSIFYKLKYGNMEKILYSALGNQIGDIFNVGIDIDRFSSYFGGEAATFFGNKSQIKLYVGGNKNFTNTFSGNIYKVGFATERNLNKIFSLFNNLGLPTDYEDVYNSFGQEILYDAGDSYFGNNADFWQYVLDGGNPESFASTRILYHTASYDFTPKILLNKFSLDIAADSYWEDYIPLSYFAKNIKNIEENVEYSLDFLQININYPAPSIFYEESQPSEWSYAELQNEFASPIQKTYDLLDNQLYTGYQNYEDLKNKLGKTYKYDTSLSAVKTFISFQYLSAGANAADAYFINKIPAPKNGVIIPGNEWINSKYEIVDSMIVYPPKGININDLAIVTHIELKSDGIVSSPIKIKKLQYASQSIDKQDATPVGTRFGTNIYPYKKSGIYLDYKTKNPFSIYKGTSPYLYLTRNSGIRLRGDYDPLVGRGLSIPINESLSLDYKTIAMQIAIRFNEDFFPYSPIQIFEIESKTKTLKFFMIATHPSGKRAKIYAINSNTGKIENGIAFYLNGRVVKDPTITIKEWAILGISFSDSLNFNNFLGSFRVTGPIMINNFSHYQSTNLQEVQQVTTRPWLRVRQTGPLSLDWQYWDSAYIWNGVLVLASTSYYGVDPSDIYKTYTGTNKIIIDDEKILRFNSYRYSMLKDIGWQASVVQPV